jgi:uncharacterized protein DUF6088
MAFVRQQIERGGERLWRLDDFRNLPFEAVAQALSRLTRQGRLERLSKGVYYSTRQTAFGKSRPNPTALQKLASRRKGVFPAGIAAANLLGFTTQTARRSEISTSALSLPRKLVGSDTVIHTRRPEAWASLSESDAALLDFLRRAGRTSELSPEETVRRTVKLLSEKGRFERLLRVAASEPPARPRDDRRHRRTTRQEPRGAAPPARFPEPLLAVRLRPAGRTAARPQLAGQGAPLI